LIVLASLFRNRNVWVTETNERKPEYFENQVG